MRIEVEFGPEDQEKLRQALGEDVDINRIAQIVGMRGGPMAPNQPEGMPAIIPMIAYEDAAAALDWLSEAFGFRERTGSRMTEPDGRITHAEMELGDGVIMLASPTPDYHSPRHHAEVCEFARK